MSDLSLGSNSVHIKNKQLEMTTLLWYLPPAVTGVSSISMDYTSPQPCMDWKSIERFCLMLAAKQVLTTRPDYAQCQTSWML
jgi:hypothetical protein